jgi:hypothetical protein
VTAPASHDAAREPTAVTGLRNPVEMSQPLGTASQDPQARPTGIAPLRNLVEMGRSRGHRFTRSADEAHRRHPDAATLWTSDHRTAPTPQDPSMRPAGGARLRILCRWACHVGTISQDSRAKPTGGAPTLRRCGVRAVVQPRLHKIRESGWPVALVSRILWRWAGRVGTASQDSRVKPTAAARLQDLVETGQSPGRCFTRFVGAAVGGVRC